MEMLQVLNSRDTRMRLEVTCFYHLVLQRLNHLSMAHHTLWPSESMHTTQLTLQTYTCFAKPTRVHSQQQRYLSRGSNREVNNARHRLRRTIRTSARFRLYLSSQVQIGGSTQFTTSQSFQTNRLIVYLNGLYQGPPGGSEINVLDNVTFTIATTVQQGESIMVIYSPSIKT